jgi:hypothetical protein
MCSISVLIIGGLAVIRILSRRREDLATSVRQQRVAASQEHEASVDIAAIQDDGKKQRKLSDANGRGSLPSPPSTSTTCGESDSGDEAPAPLRNGRPRSRDADSSRSSIVENRFKTSTARHRSHSRRRTDDSNVEAIKARLQTLEKEVLAARAMIDLDAETVRLQILSTSNARDIRVIRKIGCKPLKLCNCFRGWE